MCGEMLSDAATVERCNGPRRLRANDVDPCAQQTDTQTMLCAPSVAVGLFYAPSAGFTALNVAKVLRVTSNESFLVH